MLSDVLPLFENMGVEVADERPYPIVPRGRDGVWVYDFGLTYPGAGDLDAGGVMSFQDTFVRTWRGDVENDAYNWLVLGGALSWREITVLARSAKVPAAGADHLQRQVRGAGARLAPGDRRGCSWPCSRRASTARRTDRDDAGEVSERIEKAIDAVESLDRDQILRMFLGVIEAVLRTNYFKTGPTEAAESHLAFKLDPSELRWLPQPRPATKIAFVYSPRTEGVHLRGGTVARGGIRWSDERGDFRTEVLGLMKAQMVKNAVAAVVRRGQGGFVVKRPPARRKGVLPEEVVACYSTFIRGMLDLTDDIDGGEGRAARERGPLRRRRSVPRRGRRQGDRDVLGHRQRDRAGGGLPGSVTRSPPARLDRLRPEDEHRRARRLGVGEAPLCASWGTTCERRTSRWSASATWPATCSGTECCSRATSGWSARSTTDTSSSTRTPTRAELPRERRRLFELPTSTWEDYDRDAISPGGGVYERTAKSIQLSPEAREASGSRTRR